MGYITYSLNGTYVKKYGRRDREGGREGERREKVGAVVQGEFNMNAPSSPAAPLCVVLMVAGNKRPPQGFLVRGGNK